MRLTSFTIVLAGTLLLAGCGGGGNGTAMTDDPPEMRPEQPSGPPAGIAISAQPVQTAVEAGTLEDRISDPASMFRALSSALRQDTAAGTGVVDSSFSVRSIASDGDGGFRVTIANGDEPERTIHFTKDDLLRGGVLNVNDVEGYDYWMWSYMGLLDGIGYGGSDEFSFFRAFKAIQAADDRVLVNRAFFTIGLETPKSGLPTGTATWTGRLRGHIRDNAANSIVNAESRGDIRGALSLTADFAGGTLDGTVDQIRLRDPGESDYYDLSAGTRLEISSGRIDGNGFTATVTGADDDPNAALATSMRGYAGGAAGAFYGPNAEETGAVFNAVRGDKIMSGWFGGTSE